MNVYEEVAAFYESYRGAKLIYGKSAEGRDLFALHTGRSEGPQIVSQYAIHGREWVAALLALRHLCRGMKDGGAWVLPLANPDGALLSEMGIRSVKEGKREALARVNGSLDFSLWKANANAVDLNVNFDARWGTGAHNKRVPASENYVGPRPFSEPETRALRDFTLAIAPKATVSWHTKGEEIYWEFHQPRHSRARDKKLALVLSKSTGYPLVTVRASAGGYKDWCIEKLHIPAFTVEVGRDALPHPLTRVALGELFAKTSDALQDLGGAISEQS